MLIKLLNGFGKKMALAKILVLYLLTWFFLRMQTYILKREK